MYPLCAVIRTVALHEFHVTPRTVPGDTSAGVDGDSNEDVTPTNSDTETSADGAIDATAPEKQRNRIGSPDRTGSGADSGGKRGRHVDEDVEEVCFWVMAQCLVIVQPITWSCVFSHVSFSLGRESILCRQCV